MEIIERHISTKLKRKANLEMIQNVRGCVGKWLVH